MDQNLYLRENRFNFRYYCLIYSDFYAFDLFFHYFEKWFSGIIKQDRVGLHGKN